MKTTMATTNDDENEDNDDDDDDEDDDDLACFVHARTGTATGTRGATCLRRCTGFPRGAQAPRAEHVYEYAYVYMSVRCMCKCFCMNE